MNIPTACAGSSQRCEDWDVKKWDNRIARGQDGVNLPPFEFCGGWFSKTGRRFKFPDCGQMGVLSTFQARTITTTSISSSFKSFLRSSRHRARIIGRCRSRTEPTEVSTKNLSHRWQVRP